MKRPYSDKDYQEAKKAGLDLDDWKDYCEYFEIGQDEEEE